MKLASLVAPALSLVAFAAPAASTAPLPIPAKDTVAGLSQPELTIRWWQWAASFSGGDGPISDRSGRLCRAGQEGPVWFLAGVFGSEPVQRICHVPAGKALFFPVINYIVMPNGGSVSCSENVRTAREMTDSPIRLFAQVDGQAVEGLEQHRVASAGCFNPGERAPGRPMVGGSASDGYWLALAPLAPGRHQLHFGGALPTLAQDVTYTLIVEGTGHAEAEPAAKPAASASGTPAELAARAKAFLDDEVAPDFSAAQAAVDEALRQDPRFSPALLQAARLMLMRNGESGESLRKAELLLQGARNNDFNYGPTYPLQGHVYLKLNRPGDAMQAFNRGQRLVPNDPDFLYYYAEYLAAGYGDPFPYYERFLASPATSKSRRFSVAHELMVHDLALRDRANADAAFEVLAGIDPRAAELYGDYARNVMTWFGDFVSGEKLARKAIAMKDYRNARESLSLALYGQWAQARHNGGDAAQVAALYKKALANDPGGRLIPPCALPAPGLRDVREDLEKARAPDAPATC
jgi:tetratricopeptide (TPR) repeat protein